MAAATNDSGDTLKGISTALIKRQPCRVTMDTGTPDKPASGLHLTLREITMSQTSQILNHLQRGRPLTKLQMLDKFGVMNGGERIREIRMMGWPVKTKMISRNGKRYASYRMEA